MIETRRVAATMAQAEVTNLLAATGIGRDDELNLRPLVVAFGQVETDRAAATGAAVAITFAESTDALRLLLAAELPRVEISGDRRTGHEWTLTQEAYYAVSDTDYSAGADWASAFASAFALAATAAALPALSASSASRRSFAAW